MESNTQPTYPVDLTKLTVSQLKAICKERQITGYSKLAKAALLQKLADNSNSGIYYISSSPTITSAAFPETSRVPVDPGPTVMAMPAPMPAPDVIKKPRAPQKPKKVIRPSFESIQTNNSSDIQANDTLLPAHGVTPRSANHRTSDSTNPEITREPNSVQFRTTLSGRKRPADLLDTDASTDKLANKKQKTLQILFTDNEASLADSQSSGVASVGNSTLDLKQSFISMPPPPVPKPTKLQTGSSSKTPIRSQSDIILFKQPLPLTHTPKNGSIHTSSSVQATSNSLSTIAKGKRFKPLVSKKDVPFAHPVSLATPCEFATSNPISEVDAILNTVPLYYLDLPHLPFDSLVLAPITLPPKLSNRKYVHRWSIILSGLSNEERRQCALVSRMFRYSIYLSALRLLEQNFTGRRLAHLMLKYPQNTTNMWPYFRQRELEVKIRMQVYKESFLAKYFEDFDPISERLRTSPDNEKQMIVAIRFILTRLWFFISVGSGGNDPLAWSRNIVVDAQEVVKNEVWAVTVQTTSSQPDGAYQVAVFHVLEQTCEVIGNPLPPTHPTDVSDGPGALSSTTQVRPDWSAYIAHRQLPASAQDSPPLSLLAHLKWQNHEEYYRGISKLWLQRIASEGDSGSAKRIVADRYVLACVFGNSVSGRWMSSNQMEQDFAGNTAIVPARMQSQQVHLFLPTHHHVESLHFAAASGRPLHAALAVVQTPGREYYVLRDNGAQVGCGLGEQDGVAPIWMELLGCTALGERAISI